MEMMLWGFIQWWDRSSRKGEFNDAGEGRISGAMCLSRWEGIDCATWVGGLALDSCTGS